VLEIGPHKGLIVGHSSAIINGKEAIRITVEITGEDQNHNVLIYLTEKSIGMARASLKACGFDCDKQDLAEIDCTPPCLHGKVVDLIAEEWNGKLRLSIDLNRRMEKAQLSSLTKKLRDVKKKPDAAPASPSPVRPGEDYGDVPF